MVLGLLTLRPCQVHRCLSLCLCRIKNLFCPLRPEEGVTAEAFRLLYPQVIKDIKVCIEHGVSTRTEEWGLCVPRWRVMCPQVGGNVSPGGG